jgi:hypothetical protein
MLSRPLALVTVLFALSLPGLAIAQPPPPGEQAKAIQAALDDLEVVEALLQGKVTNATREQALSQLREARVHLLAVQNALLLSQLPPGGAVVTVTEGPASASGSVHVGAPGAGLSINLTVNEGAQPEPPIAIPPQNIAPAPPPPPPVQSLPAVMPPAAFATLRGAIQTESFGDGKLRVLRGALDAHRLNVKQAEQLLPLFDFSSDRVEAAVAIHPRLVDPENFYQLYGSFDFESDKETVRKRLGL